MPKQNRREILHAGMRLATAAVLDRLTVANAFAASVSPSYKALVCIFQLGGNDSNNVVVPLATSGGDTGNQSFLDYQKVRPTTGLGLTQGALLPIMVKKDIYGLHPNLRNLQSLYSAGKAAVLSNVGNLVQPTTVAEAQAHASSNDGFLPETLYAHDEQQKQWQTAVPRVAEARGWAGRVADSLSQTSEPPMPINFILASDGRFAYGGTTSPISLSGFDPQIGLPTNKTPGLNRLLSFDNGLRLVQAHNKIMSDGLNDHVQLSQALNSMDVATSQALAGRFAGLSDPLSSQLLLAAKIVAVSKSLGVVRQTFYVTHGSYDTHSGERGSTGQDGLLAVLDNAVSAFYGCTLDLGAAAQVTTFTSSEFGRTLRPNSNLGTDHAWGAHHFIIGGAVKGGDMYGTFPTLRFGGPDDVQSDPSASTGVLLPTTSVVQYFATLSQWFGISWAAGDLLQVFPTLPNFNYDPAIGLGFFKSASFS